MLLLTKNKLIHVVINKKKTILLKNLQKLTDFFHAQVVMNVLDPGRKIRIRISNTEFMFTLKVHLHEIFHFKLVWPKEPI